MKPKYKYIFIDLDDTIWDFRANSKASLKDLFKIDELVHLNGEFDTFFTVYTKKNKELWDQYGLGEITKEYLSKERFAYPLAAIGIHDDSTAIKMNQLYLNILADKAHLIPHSVEFLEYCKANNLIISIISNGFVEVQYRKLRSANIEHYFDYIVLSDQVGALKPHPEIFEHTLQLNNAKKSEVVMIGDSVEADIKGAAAFGIDCIFLNRDREKQYELPERAKQIHCFSEIYEHLN